MRKYWVDIFNGPHVHFFQKLHYFLHDIMFTARNYAPIPELIDLYKIDAKVIGAHGGKDYYEKMLASLDRSIEMAKYIHGQSIDILIHKHSVEAARVAWGMAIPAISYIDNELMVPQNMLVCPLSNVLIAPIAIDQSTLRDFTPSHVSILQFDGVCEIANVYKFKPDETVLSSLNIDTKKPIIVLRGEPILAAYNKGVSITEQLIANIKRDVPDAQVIHINRVGEDNQNNHEIFDARSLSYYADIVISGGGTMTREAALLGTRAISFFNTPLAVDKYLMKKNLVESYPGEKILSLNWKKELFKVSKKHSDTLLSDLEHPFEMLPKAIKLIEMKHK